MSKKKEGGNPLFLSIENLKFFVNETQILFIKSLDVKFYKLLLIKGAVGAGKTTLLKVLSGVYTPTEGHFHISSNSPVNKLYIHSNPVFNFITGRVIDEAELLRVSDKKLKIDLNRNVDEYSGGELKKLSIELSVLSDYNLILADEPFNMLDDNEVEKLKCFLLNSFDKAKFIITTHEDILDEYADAIIRLKDGSLA
jgi:ABC-type lipoprotein export system ATPase subunit